MQGAIAEARKQAHSKLCNCFRNAEDGQKDQSVSKVIKFTFLSINKQVLLMLALSFFMAPVNAIDVIVNHAVPGSATFSTLQYRSIFTMRQKYWPNDKPIKVFVLPDDHPLHKKFAKNKLNMLPFQLRRIWNKMIFSGTGRGPVTIATEREMLEKVSSTPNSIGYVDKGSKNEKIRLFIEQ